MSKLEDALRKVRARAEGTPASEPGKALSLSPAPEQALSLQPSATHAIARMQEPWQLSKGQMLELRMIFPGMPDSRIMNAFREARTRILQRTGGRNCSLLVTGVSKKAGTSFVARNLAVSFSLDGAKTALLIDCDVQNPAHNELLPSQNRLGLSEYLESEEIGMEQIIHPVGVPRLRLIPAGCRRPDTVEYFTSTKIRRMFGDVRERYPDRYVILDAPPILESADARILTEVCDYAVLVLPHGQATEETVIAAARAIGPEKFAGIVFTNEPRLPKISDLRTVKAWLGKLHQRTGASAGQ